MKNWFIGFAIFSMLCLGSPTSAMDTCYKIEFEGEVFSFVAPETGTYTFKGGSVETSPNGYLITVTLEAGEVWVVPPVGEVPGAAISHVVICPGDPIDPENPDCIHKDPATIRYGEIDSFRMHGRLLPVTPLIFSEGLLATLTADGVTLLTAEVAAEAFVVNGNRVWAKTDDVTVRFRQRGDTQSVVLKYVGEILQSPTDQIVFDLIVGDQWFRVSGSWKSRKTGWFLSNKNYICAE